MWSIIYALKRSCVTAGGEWVVEDQLMAQQRGDDGYKESNSSGNGGEITMLRMFCIWGLE